MLRLSPVGLVVAIVVGTVLYLAIGAGIAARWYYLDCRDAVAKDRRLPDTDGFLQMVVFWPMVLVMSACFRVSDLAEQALGRIRDSAIDHAQEGHTLPRRAVD